MVNDRITWKMRSKKTIEVVSGFTCSCAQNNERGVYTYCNITYLFSESVNVGLKEVWPGFNIAMKLGGLWFHDVLVHIGQIRTP